MKRDGDELVCSDGQRFPLSSLGMQAADMHEAGLRRVRKPSPFSLSLTWRDTTATVFADVFVVSRRDRRPGGTQSWHPLHVKFRGERHVHIKRTRPERL